MLPRRILHIFPLLYYLFIFVAFINCSNSTIAGLSAMDTGESNMDFVTSVPTSVIKSTPISSVYNSAFVAETSGFGLEPSQTKVSSVVSSTVDVSTSVPVQTSISEPSFSLIPSLDNTEAISTNILPSETQLSAGPLVIQPSATSSLSSARTLSGHATKIAGMQSLMIQLSSEFQGIGLSPTSVLMDDLSSEPDSSEYSDLESLAEGSSSPFVQSSEPLNYSSLTSTADLIGM